MAAVHILRSPPISLSSQTSMANRHGSLLDGFSEMMAQLRSGGKPASRRLRRGNERARTTVGLNRCKLTPYFRD